ncbi:MAG: globin domain-containing protein [Chloroflexota bacterium]
MTPTQKKLIRASYHELLPHVQRAGTLFYQRLFEIEPAFEQLFQHDIDAQGQKLFQTIGVAVEYLDVLERVRPTLKQMGERHERYGVRPADYAVVEETLYWTFEAVLGDAFTAEVKSSWEAIYAYLVTAMTNTPSVKHY